jgi:putative flippase GtrA
MWQPRRVLRWALLGITASLVELGLLHALYDGLTWPLPIATATAAEVLILAKFLTNDRFVFGHSWPTLPRLVRYHGASLGALVVYWLVLNALSLIGGMPYVAAFVFGTAAAFAWSLITNFAWVWEQHNLPEGPVGYARPRPFPTRKLSRSK